MRRSRVSAQRARIADGLSHFLADAYTLYLKTHNFHWNVTGPMFNTLHLMFETQYNEQWTALASLLWDIQFKGNLEHLEASYKIADGWTARLAGDLLDGRPETPLGTYKRNDRVLLSLNMLK